MEKQSARPLLEAHPNLAKEDSLVASIIKAKAGVVPPLALEFEVRRCIEEIVRLNTREVEARKDKELETYQESERRLERRRNERFTILRNQVLRAQKENIDAASQEESRIKQTVAQVAEERRELQVKEQSLKERAKHHMSVEQEHSRIKAELLSKEEDVHRRELAANDREAGIARLTAETDQRQQAKEDELKQLRERLHGLERELGGRKRQIDDVRRQTEEELKEKEEQLCIREQNVAKEELRHASARQQLEEREETLQHREQEVRKLEARVEAKTKDFRAKEQDFLLREQHIVQREETCGEQASNNRRENARLRELLEDIEKREEDLGRRESDESKEQHISDLEARLAARQRAQDQAERILAEREQQLKADEAARSRALTEREERVRERERAAEFLEDEMKQSSDMGRRKRLTARKQVGGGEDVSTSRGAPSLGGISMGPLSECPPSPVLDVDDDMEPGGAKRSRSVSGGGAFARLTSAILAPLTGKQ